MKGVDLLQSFVFSTIFLGSTIGVLGQKKSSGTSVCYDFDQVIKVEPTDLYKPHLQASKSFTVDLLKTDATFQKFVKMKRLHQIPQKNTGYRLQKLTHSRSYLNFKAKKVLRRMGEQFYKESKGGYFTVSSLTRTLTDQCNLRKVNKNASLGISSHNYGNSFDISYVRFNGRLRHDAALEKKLYNVLEDFRKSGKIFYIKEKQQSCYHVTVRNY